MSKLKWMVKELPNIQYDAKKITEILQTEQKTEVLNKKKILKIKKKKCVESSHMTNSATSWPY